MDASRIVKEILAKTPGGIQEINYIGCGGSRASVFAGHYLMKHEAKAIASNWFNSNEFVHAAPRSLGPGSVCVVCSLKATPESLEALRLANARGAATVALTGSLDTGLAKEAQYPLVYTTRADGNQAHALRIGFELLHQQEAWRHYAEAQTALEKVDPLIAGALERSLSAAREFGLLYKDDQLFHILASGSAYSAAYIMAFCHLMEMQWKHAVPIHSGEYFHGPFEATDKDLPTILIKSTGRTRPLDERVERFLAQYASRVTIIDTANLGLPSLGAHVAEYFNSVLMLTVAHQYVDELSKQTGHPMQHRRYMWQFDY